MAEKDWRMPAKCSDCPFHTSGPGLTLRRSLRPGRFRGILASLRQRAHFVCHKTGDVGEPPTRWKLCAGAIDWQERRGLTSQLQQVAERLDIYAKILATPDGFYVAPRSAQAREGG